jgi:PBP1b-binding outer membrane lipoprotein LpoB
MREELAFVFVAVLAGCASPRRAGAYAPVDEKGIATRGVDTQDYQLVVETIVASMLKGGLQAEAGQKPVIELGAIFNRTPYNIQTRMLGERVTEANFTFNLTLTEVKTGLAVWADTKPIRKNIL